MSFAQSLPRDDKSLIANEAQTKTYTIEEKFYTLSTNFYDIGEYLEKLKIKPYQTISVTIKGGSYRWEKPYTMPHNSNLALTGEGFQNGGKSNKVTILMGEKHTFQNGNEQCAKNVRLIVSDSCVAKIQGINIFEKINDNRKLTPNSKDIGIFNVCNAKFYLMQGLIEFADSPLINVGGQSIGTIYFGHTFFERNPMSFNKEVKIVGTQTGWDFAGNKAIVSKSHTHPGNGCILESTNKIELIS